MIALLGDKELEKPLQVVIEELLKRVKGNVTLIIDEANIAFTITEDTNAEEVKALRGILATFTKLAKESGKV